jgi:SOS-response transcriptional repressor LexA
MSRPRKKSDREVLNAVALLIVKLGMPPTIAELRRVLKVGSSRTVLRYLLSLEKQGLIKRWPGARGLRILVGDDDECPWCGRI